MEIAQLKLGGITIMQTVSKGKSRIKEYPFRMSPRRMATLKRDYELANKPKVALARKYGISESTLWKMAKELEWEYGGKRRDFFEDFEKRTFKRMNEERVDAVESHAIELSLLREKLKSVESKKEAELLERKVDILLKCIKGERTAYGLPNEFRQVESKTENVFRVEDMVKSLDMKRNELKVVNDTERLDYEGGKEGREGIAEAVIVNASEGEELVRLPREAIP